MKRTLLLLLILVLLVPIGWSIHLSVSASGTTAKTSHSLTTIGNWNAHFYDLVYTVAFSSEQQPNGPLVVYRASGADLHNAVPVIAVQRGPQPATPLFFPSPDGHYLALLTPHSSSANTDINGAMLTILSTSGTTNSVLLSAGVAASDDVVWSADSQALYYHSGIQQPIFVSGGAKPTVFKGHPSATSPQFSSYDDISRIDLRGKQTRLFQRMRDTSSIRLVGFDRNGGLILTLAQPRKPVLLLRVDTHTQASSAAPKVIATLPSDILPGNVLRIGNDGLSVECERVLSWQPLRYTLVHIGLTDGTVTPIQPLFNTSHFGSNISPLSRSADGQIQVMAQVNSIRQDLAMQGIPNVPAQESLLLADTTTRSTQQLALPSGGQLVQAFWTEHLAAGQIHALAQSTIAHLLTPHTSGSSTGVNASVIQQDEWMLEGHANRLADAPKLPTMCYGYCTQGPVGPPHVSAAILHGVAYVESNWHQFNTTDYHVNGEAPGTPIESFDGGWGEFQQTWGMPPQCNTIHNCRGDATNIEQDQSYNIGVGTASLISAWNGTAGVVSSSDSNDPHKANQWFFAVWAYNGSYGNNPNDVASSAYGHWYPGAPFRSIYEEYVWYFAAHQEYTSNKWTDNYLPALGSSLLPPQSDFANTSDSFVVCVTCTIPDWTSGSYDTDWVGAGAPDSTTGSYFKASFQSLGGEDVVGLPRDNGGSAAVHRWNAGLVQDYGGGSALPGVLMLADGTTMPYFVYGGVWTQYLTVDGGTGGCHGYPTSALAPYLYLMPRAVTSLRQTFQHGYIIWDTIQKKVTTDSCS